MRISTQIVKEQSAPAPKIIHLAHQSKGVADDLPPLRGQVLREILQKLHSVRLDDGEVPQQAAQGVQLLQQLVHGSVLVIGELIVHPHIVRGPGLDGDVENTLRPALIILTAARVVYGLHLA